MCFDGGWDVDSDFVRTHENMTDCFASIDPLHPTLLQSNKRLFERKCGEERGAGKMRFSEMAIKGVSHG